MNMSKFHVTIQAYTVCRYEPRGYKTKHIALPLTRNLQVDLLMQRSLQGGNLKYLEAQEQH